MTDELGKFATLDVDETDLNGELCRQCSSFVHVGRMFCEAEAEYERYKMRVKQLQAALDEQVRLNAAREGKKITEAAITKEIERHPDYVKAMEHQINLYRRKEELRHLRDGWRDRKDMLIQRCINQRTEMEQTSHATVRSLSAM